MRHELALHSAVAAVGINDGELVSARDDWKQQREWFIREIENVHAVQNSVELQEEIVRTECAIDEAEERIDALVKDKSADLSSIVAVRRRHDYLKAYLAGLCFQASNAKFPTPCGGRQDQ